MQDRYVRVIIVGMKPDLTKYNNKKICVAVSGGRDSAALLTYLHAHAKEYGITLTALNCDHGIRGAQSARDSAFVAEYCKFLGVPLLFFKHKARKNLSESEARVWRLKCYQTAVKLQAEWTEEDELPARVPESGWFGADAVATAHHLDDNAETVLFNLARGSGLAGLCGITDAHFVNLEIIRPFVGVPRSEIEEYISSAGVKYVDDATNFSNDYTRNKIRLNVLPELEKAVGGAARSIYRFSRLAAEDEEYFDSLITGLGLVQPTPRGVLIRPCNERAVFKRAALRALGTFGDVRDYNADQLERLYAMQSCENGKKFCFLGFAAYKEEDGVFIVRGQSDCGSEEMPFADYISLNSRIFGGQTLIIVPETELEAAFAGVKSQPVKTLKFDFDSVPDGATVRFSRAGDRFTKFGGGTKNLGDYFTDKKIPLRNRANIPLIAVGADIYAVCGVEISEKIKVTDRTRKICYIISADFRV